MDESLHARIQHEIAELRAAYPRIAHCHGALEDWDEGGERRYAMRLDIRWPQHQTLLTGGAHPDPYSALRAAFDAAARHIAQAYPRAAP
jgi:hypothetical protein